MTPALAQSMIDVANPDEPSYTTYVLKQAQNRTLTFQFQSSSQNLGKKIKTGMAQDNFPSSIHPSSSLPCKVLSARSVRKALFKDNSWPN